MEGQKSYALYAGKIPDLPQGLQYSYIGQHHKYALVYATENPLPNKFIEVDERLAKTLTDGEKTWLAKCAVAVNVKYLKDNETEMVDYLTNFLDKWEEELQKEQTRQAEKKEQAPTDTADTDGTQN